MIPDVQQAPRNAQDDPHRPMGRQANKSQPQSHENNTDVFNAVICQQTLDVMLSQREHHAQQRVDRTERQNNHAPYRRRVG